MIVECDRLFLEPQTKILLVKIRHYFILILQKIINKKRLSFSKYELNQSLNSNGIACRLKEKVL